MLIAVEGCMHGELSAVFSTLLAAPQPPQLLLCCGDFQSTRNRADLQNLAVPAKYRHLADFHLYYSGKKKAPILTIFVGGNHEASNYLQELPYGGWVAPNIYYLGAAGVVTIGGIRIGGVSGIYKGHDYLKGHFESPPYSEDTKRSVYHYRNLEMFRLHQLSGNLDIFLSHDWPNEITQYGNLPTLLRNKPFFQDDIRNGKLGSPPLQTLLRSMQPKYWFAAHLHCFFPAIVHHEENDSNTKFLALDKCLPRRKFLQILDIPHDEKASMELQYDLEWLTVLHLTNNLLSVRSTNCHMPGKNSPERWNFTPTESEKEETLKLMGNDLSIPLNFEMTAEAFDSESPNSTQSVPVLNPQNSLFCNALNLDDPVSLIMLQKGNSLQLPSKNFTFHNNLPDQSVDADADTNADANELTSSNISVTDSLVTSRSSTSRLSLPEPVKKIEDSFEDDSSTNVIQSETETTEIEDLSQCETPIVKKVFIRRNESLYKSNVED